MASEEERLRLMLREIWVRLQGDFILPDMLGRDLASRIRREFAGEDPYAAALSNRSAE